MSGMGDLKVAEARDYKTLHKLILKACSSSFTAENKGNCSGFVKAVGSRLGIRVGTTGAGQANDIYSEIAQPPWYQLGKGEKAAVKAAHYAKCGFLVIAAWKSEAGNGHVAVVTDIRDLAKTTINLTDRNVAASWGVLDHEELAQNNGRIRESFGQGKRDEVRYAAHFLSKFR